MMISKIDELLQMVIVPQRTAVILVGLKPIDLDERFGHGDGRDTAYLVGIMIHWLGTFINQPLSTWYLKLPDGWVYVTQEFRNRMDGGELP